MNVIVAVIYINFAPLLQLRTCSENQIIRLGDKILNLTEMSIIAIKGNHSNCLLQWRLSGQD